MKFTQKQKQYLNSKKELIKSGDFYSFFQGIGETERPIFARFFYVNGIDILSNMKVIPDRLFYGCDALSGITIGDGCIEIGDEAFASCPNLYAVYMPDSVKKIGIRAFADCMNLEKVRLSESITAIPTGCFSRDYKLGEIIIPASVETIRPKSFEFCDQSIIRVSDPSKISFKSSEKDFFKQHLRKMKKTESFHKKSKKLTEAFDPSFPSWLVKGLSQKTSFDARDSLRNKGVDLSRVTFVDKDEMPQKRNDPYLQNSDLIPVFDVVMKPYSSGVPEHQIFVYGYGPDRPVWNERKGKQEDLTKLGLRDLIDMSAHWGYIDKSDASFSNLRNMRRDRGTTKAELQDSGQLRYEPLGNGKEYDYYYDPVYDSGGKYGHKDAKYKKSGRTSYDKYWHSVPGGTHLDKSGYVVLPPAQKYKDALVKIKKEKAIPTLQKLYSDLRYLQKVCRNAISDMDFMDADSSVQVDELTSLIRQFPSLNNTYKDILSAIEYFGMDPNARSVNLPTLGYISKDSIFNSGGYLDNFTNRVNGLRSVLSNYEDAFVDWDVEESLKKKNKFSLDESIFKEDIENLKDVDLIINPVMQNAKKQSEKTTKRIKDELKKDDIPSWDSEKVIGANKQPIPDKVKYPKAGVKESFKRRKR